MQGRVENHKVVRTSEVRETAKEFVCSREIDQSRKNERGAFYHSYAVDVLKAFRNAFLNLSARTFFRAGVVAGMGNGSVVVSVVVGGSREWFG